MTNIILCGGNGARLWPISTNSKPKQFIKLFNNRSLFELNIKRNDKIVDKHIVVSNESQHQLVKSQLDALDVENVECILESIGRNTAPAVALACFGLDKEEIVLVTPADHLIKNEGKYLESVYKAVELAKENVLVTFGIVPKYPEVGYGYIEVNNNDVKTFHEKPDLNTAKTYIKNENFYWNSGIFCFKAGIFLEELKKYSQDIYRATKSIYKEPFNYISKEDMLKVPEDSIDYAVMEKSKIVKMIKSDIGWSDLGSFESLYDELEKDEYLNVKNENLYQVNSSSNMILGNNKPIVLIDVDDLVVINTKEALLVSKKGSSQKIKSILKDIKR